MLNRLPADGIWLDPAAGAGAFLVGIVRRYGLSILERLYACDIDGEALDVAALALEAALGSGARAMIARWRRDNARVVDFLRGELHVTPDIIVGNPPYGISDDDSLAQRFPVLRGERDLYACFLVRATQCVQPGGTVSLLVPDTWLTNSRSASLRGVLAADVAEIVDFGKPFATARDTRVHAVTVRAGAPGCRVASTRNGRLDAMASVPRQALIDSAARGWFLYRTSAERDACAVIECGTPLRRSFDVIYGLRTGDNAAHVRPGSGAIPLIGGRDLDAFDRRVAPKHLIHADSFHKALQRQLGRVKLGVQRIRTNSSLSWRRWIEAAPLQAEEAGLDSLTLIAGGSEDELWALLGVLNSSIFNRWYRLTFTDVNVKPAYLAEVPIPQLSAPLAALVRMRIAAGPSVQLERAIDRVVADCYGLSDVQIRCFEEEYWGPRLADVPLPSLEESLGLAPKENRGPVSRSRGRLVHP